MVIGVFGKLFEFAEMDILLGGLKVQNTSSLSKKARIVATIGPASSDRETLEKMILAGMDVARFNFFHGTHKEYAQTLANIRAAEEKWGKPIAVSQDLCGPKIRTGQMENNGARLEAGKIIVIQADAIMIACGDMGIELPTIRVSRIQQEIINLCWRYNTPVITANQMLDSMTVNTIQTRAEVTDVTVAIKEGTDAVMLSGETVVGDDPVNVICTMASIITEEERYNGQNVFEMVEVASVEANPAIVAAANLQKEVILTMLLDARGILYPQISKYNRDIPNIMVTRSRHIARHSSLYKNIVPIIIPDEISRDEVVFEAGAFQLITAQ